MARLLRALIVEDDENDAILVVRDLRRGGYDVTFKRVATREDMVRALEISPWDIVIADYAIPGFGAIAALSIFRKHKLEIPFIVVSGAVGEDVAVETMRAGAHDYVLKGNLTRLVPAVERELHEAELRRRYQKSEEALRASDIRFERLVESNFIGIVVADRDKITNANKAFLTMIGYTREEMIAGEIRWRDITPPEYRDLDERGLRELAAYGYSAPFEKEYYRKDGSRVSFLIGGTLLEREPFKFICFVLDLTDRKRLEQERQRLFREQEARKLAETANSMKDQFLAAFSHELRTPLNAIMGWSEIMRKKPFDQTLFADALGAIHRNAEAQARLIDDILDVSRIIAGQLQLHIRPVELTQIADAAIDSIRPEAEAKGISIDKEFDSSMIVISGDPTRLQQVVWNLLSNAVKFTSNGGKVKVSVRRLEPKAEIVIRDTGEGISADFLPHVFERFRQADSSPARSHSGLGLGLAIAYDLVELHGGTLTAESPGEGQGSAFTVRLPLDAFGSISDHPYQASQGPESSHGVEGSNALEGLRILAVDDHADTRKLLSLILESYGAETRTAMSAPEALEMLKTWKPHVLVSDIGMPNEDGYSLIRKVRNLGTEEGGNTLAIALTGYAGSEQGERALLAGYQMHLTKPIEEEKLVRLILDLTRGSQENHRV